MMYLPVQVGAEKKESLGYARDNEGENISKKNPNYCELTGLYWAWKIWMQSTLDWLIIADIIQ